MRYLLFCLVWLAACTSNPLTPEPTEVMAVVDEAEGEEAAISVTNTPSKATNSPEMPELLSLEDAQAQLNYTPYLPTYIFPDGYILEGIDVQQAEQLAAIIYELKRDAGSGANALLVIQQYPGDSFLDEWTESEMDHVEEVTIGNNLKGEYLVEALTFNEGGILQTLRWQQDGLYFVITEAGGSDLEESPLNQQALTDIAASMSLAE